MRSEYKRAKNERENVTKERNYVRANLQKFKFTKDTFLHKNMSCAFLRKLLHCFSKINVTYVCHSNEAN